MYDLYSVVVKVITAGRNAHYGLLVIGEGVFCFNLFCFVVGFCCCFLLGGGGGGWGVTSVICGSSP